MLPKALAIWLVIVAVEAVHGVLRTLYLVRLLGDLPARQVGVAVGSLLILLVAWLTVRWIGARSVRQWRSVGALWVTLMIVAELVLGRFAFGYPWSRIAEDFDPTQGGLLGFGMLVLYFAPSWMARLRGLATARRDVSF
jgi:hypothetical protein